MTSTVGILVVDDDREMCDYLQLFLSQEGHRVKTLTDPLAVTSFPWGFGRFMSVPRGPAAGDQRVRVFA